MQGIPRWRRKWTNAITSLCFQHDQDSQVYLPDDENALSSPARTRLPCVGKRHNTPLTGNLRQIATSTLTLNCC